MTRIYLRRAVLLFVLTAASAFAAHGTALDRYVAAPDSHFRYELVKTIPGSGYTTFVLDLTSQQWRSAAEVDRPVWKHWLIVVKPELVESDIGFLFITGGDNGDPPPSKQDPMLVALATETNSVVAELRMVPNQPLVFAGDGKRRVEDAIVAYTWDKYLRTGDDTWPARLPMTKAAVRAMDAVTGFAAGDVAGHSSVKRFVVAGGSKRGWTTWTTAAVDKRVVAIVPLVIDLLNLQKSFEHHYRAYGFWAPAIKDYQDMDLMSRSFTPAYTKLMKIVEPYSYRDRLTMPKYLINASGDEFFLPDSSRFYWDGLKGEKYLRYVPNARHSLAGSDARDSVLAFYSSVVKGTERPKLSWKFNRGGGIRVKTLTKPSAVKLWQATNPKARDFRMDSIGKAYRSSPLADRGNGVYTAKLDKPASGFTAYFIEMTYPMGKHSMKVTSGVRVVPDILPYPAPPKKAK